MPFFPALVIFDLDGTLIDYEHEFLYREFLGIVRQHGLDQITEEIVASHHSRDDLFGCIPGEAKRIAIERAFVENFRDHQKPPARLLPGAIETLDYLATRKVQLAIATARAELPDSIRENLRHTGLLRWIDCITARSCRTLPWRDKSEQILAACQHAAVSAGDSFMVGDNPSDSVSAHAAGVGGVIAVRTGKIVDELLKKAKPHLILNTVGEIPDSLREHEQE
jgi:phosphoglycolate phosphatase-like HAD superfamily hydrolase